MRYFESLPKELQDKAWDQLGKDLIQSWLDRWCDELGDTLDSYVEEWLLTELSHDGTDYVNQAETYYTHRKDTV